MHGSACSCVADHNRKCRSVSATTQISWLLSPRINHGCQDAQRRTRRGRRHNAAHLKNLQPQCPAFMELPDPRKKHQNERERSLHCFGRCWRSSDTQSQPKPAASKHKNGDTRTELNQPTLLNIAQMEEGLQRWNRSKNKKLHPYTAAHPTTREALQRCTPPAP